MEKTTSLVKKLKNSALGIPHLTHLTFLQGEMFGWGHTACAITYDSKAPNASAYLLHEYAHALLRHLSYSSDIELITMERAAWDKALEIAPSYNIVIDGDLIEDALDTYRDWLHCRSLCPSCEATGIQSAADQYSCIACGGHWQVNEARHCALRRYHIKKRS